MAGRLGANKSSDLRPNDHHFYWPKENYEPYKFFWPLRSVPRQFRGLTTNRGLIPKQFHNVIHEISLPPNTPSKYHMRRYIKSYEIARSLFSHAKLAMLCEGRIGSPEQAEKFEQHVEDYRHIFEDYPEKLRRALAFGAFTTIGLTEDFDTHDVASLYGHLIGFPFNNIPNYTIEYFDSAA